MPVFSLVPKSNPKLAIILHYFDQELERMRVEVRERDDQDRLAFCTSVERFIALCQNKGTAMIHHSKDINNPVY